MISTNVRTFFTHIIQVSLLTAVFIGLVFLGISPDKTHYFFGSLLQTKLLEDTSGSRVVLVGGSNVAFGIDAQLMQEALGLPVINDGLHVGLGVVPLRQVQEYIHSGDIIIISLEYSVFSSKSVMDGNPAFLADWIEYSPRRIKYLSNPVTETPLLYGVMLQRKVNRELSYYLLGGSLDEMRGIFNGARFDANGDFIGHLKEDSLAQKKIPLTPYPVSPVQDDIFVFLESFSKIAREKGAEVFFEAPSSRQSNCSATGEAAMANFFTTFKERSSITILTPLEEVCMADEYFFDTIYHLNSRGREIKTERLIKNLLKAMRDQR